MIVAKDVSELGLMTNSRSRQSWRDDLQQWMTSPLSGSEYWMRL